MLLIGRKVSYPKRLVNRQSADTGMPKDLDIECAPLVVALNSIPGVKTSCSCCGHLKDRYMIWFYCKNLRSLAIIGRAFDDRYGGCEWTLEIDTADMSPKSYPMFTCFLHSKKPFKTWKEMHRSIWGAAGRLYYWADPIYRNHFDGKEENK